MFIFSNLATSLDGKIATSSRVFYPLGTPEDRKQMIVLRRECDAILMGASTIRTYKKPALVPDAPAQPYNVVISRNLEGLSPSWPFFSDSRNRRILMITGKIPPRRLSAFEKTSEVIRLKKPSKKNPVGKQMIAELEKRGVKRLLVEGGGTVMWDFASLDLIDEYHVTLTPRIVGGTEAPTLVDGPGFEPSEIVNLKLAECRQLGDELYLLYRKTGQRGPLA